MRAPLVMIMVIAALICGPKAVAQITDLSNARIDIRYSFEGADLILFGSVGNAAIDNGQDYDVVVVVRGPEVATTIRKKARRTGIWVNAQSLHFPAAPGYYAVAANRPLADIASEDVYKASGIGFRYLRLAIQGGPSKEAERPTYMAALERIKSLEGLYRSEQDPVTIRDQGLFRTDIRLPATVPVGEYFVDTYIVQDGRIRGSHRITLPVDKAGFERAVYSFAHDYPAFYGLIAIIIALGAGWIAGVAGGKK